MSATAVTERPAHTTRNGGVPARRAVVRWAIRLLRREWRQQLLILALITVAVGATVVAATVATNTPAPIAGVLGTAQDAASLSGSPAAVNAQIKNLENRWGRVDVIENESVQVPGTLNTFELRAQDRRGPYGGPLLSLISGQYPATASQIAVTSGVAADFHLTTGSDWTVAGKTWKVTGIVQNPQSLLDEFALVIPGQVANPDNVTVLFDAPGASASSLSTTTMNVTTAQTVANTNEVNPETISIAAAVLGMLLIALVGVGGFTVLAQRRLRAIGMLAAQGATQRHIRLVVRANGAATGIVGAIAGAALGFLAWLAYRPQAENSAHHVMGVFQLPWTVIGISMALAIIATYFAASRPARTIAKVPVVAALAGRRPRRRRPGTWRSRSVSVSWSARSCCSAPPGPRLAAAEARTTGRWNSPSASSRSPSPSCCSPRRSCRWSPPPASGARSRSGSRCAIWRGTGPGPDRRWRRSASAR